MDFKIGSRRISRAFVNNMTDEKLVVTLNCSGAPLLEMIGRRMETLIDIAMEKQTDIDDEDYEGEV